MAKMKKKIMIVEDEAYLVDAYQTILRANGYSTEAVTDGMLAVDRIGKVSPRLVLLDVRLPGIDGIEILRQLAEKDLRIPVIVLSNHSVRSEIDAAHQYGAVRYIVKSWTSPGELVEIVKETIGP